MAGDIPIEERLVVRSAAATGFGAAAAGRQDGVLHSYGDRVRVVRGAQADAGTAVPQGMPEGLSETEALGFAATRLRLDPAYAEAKRTRPRDGETWDFEGGCVHVPPGPKEARAAVPGTPTSAYLEGSVAVGLIIVEGPGNDLRFDGAERVKTVAEVQNGLSYFASTQPSAGLSFTYDIRVVQVDVPPEPDVPDRESLWREPALRQLGYDGSRASVGTYVEDLRQKFGTRWAFCAFITKYPLFWFAYASALGGPYLVMDYANDGWGVENIDRVFAHETGHVFCAPDEYGACGGGGAYGRWGKPNDNCEATAPDGGVPCLMKGNSFSMCVYTPAHLGWMPARVISKQTGKAADIGGSQAAHGAHLVQRAFSGGVTQWFRPDPVGDGCVRLVAHDSCQVLDVAEARTDNGAPLILWDWHGGDNQLFTLEPLGDGHVRIIPKNAPHKIVTVTGAGDGDELVLGEWSGGDDQRWLLTAPLVVEHSAKVMAVAGASTADGAAVVQWDPAGHAEQIFRPDPVGVEHVRLVCHHSGKVVGVRNGSTLPGAPLVQTTWTGADSQLFKLVLLDGTFRIIAKHSGMVLAVAGTSMADGAIVVQRPWTGGDEQRWLVPYVETAIPPMGSAPQQPVSAGLA